MGTHFRGGAKIKEDNKERSNVSRIRQAQPPFRKVETLRNRDLMVWNS